ncbi:WD40 repeat-like protein [Ascodesmis nigricans]|uniref:WD40 repeat-like protein n=1 Tax=Ascodesmis nigricans TaxID=341454 RepID=A0A4S2MVU7_9PEZI|nr:WD40 repeat-like protein [Ascodesmis nigricans]
MEWCRSSADSPCIYWLCAMAGMGKSTIARTVSMACDNEKRLGASFFFCKDDENLKNAQNFVTTIAFQLAEHIHGLKPLVGEAIKNQPDISEKTLEIQWKHLISDPLNSLDKPILEGFVVIIDALDECENNDDIQLILRVLARANEIHATHLKVFVTSRPETPIRKIFGYTMMKMHQLQILHHVPRETIDHNIRLYFQDQLKDDVTPENLDRLVEKAGGLFISAATACLFLKGAPAMKEKRLNLLLTNGTSSQNPEKVLDSIYTSILLSAIKDKYDEDEYEEVFKRYKRIVGAIILVSIPIPMDTLSRLLRLSKEAINDIIGDLHSVLDIPADNSYPIRTLHLSFRDFLLSGSRCQNTNLRIDELQGHRNLLSECLKCMSDKLRENMCDIPYPGISSCNVKKEIIEKALPPDLQYACRYWIYHLQRSGNEVSNDGNIEKFLQTHFLHWLEALSLMGMVLEGIDAIRALESKVSSDGNERLYELSHDARRFITKHRKTIEDAPLQIYSSALIFSPTSSIIRQQFTKKIPMWIKTPPLVRENWDPLLQTREGHSDSVETLAFSPDGETLASGSSDNTVRLWDPVTGASRGTLEGHSDTVFTLEFSPNGKTLASGSWDKTVRLWDPATGALHGTLEGHSDTVKTLAFSPDGNTLASGSWDKTVRLWDPATRASRGTLEGHSSGVNTLAFSPDGKILASGSWDKTVRLWDPATGALRGTLEGHSGSVFTLAFSPNGKILASGSWDNTVRLWDLATGASCGTLEGHSSRVNTLAFSPDENAHASGPWDKTVRLWDLASGALRGTLEDHSDWIKTLAFSSDGKFLADCQSSNGQLNPWGTSGSWITHEQHNMLFLPVDVRPRCYSIFSAFVAWGDAFGRVYTMELSSYQPPSNSIYPVNAGIRKAYERFHL